MGRVGYVLSLPCAELTWHPHPVYHTCGCIFSIRGLVNECLLMYLQKNILIWSLTFSLGNKRYGPLNLASESEERDMIQYL